MFHWSTLPVECVPVYRYVSPLPGRCSRLYRSCDQWQMAPTGRGRRHTRSFYEMVAHTRGAHAVASPSRWPEPGMYATYRATGLLDALRTAAHLEEPVAAL